MGWLSYLVLGDLGQQLEIHDQREELRRLKHRLYRQAADQPSQDDVQALRAENAELRLYVAVLYRLLMTKGIASADEIRRLMEALDAADGTPDGGFSGDVVTGRPDARIKPAEENPFAGLG